MERVVVVDVLNSQAFNRFELVIVLPDAAKGDAQTIVKVRIRDCNIGAVAFQRDAVVSVIDCPVVEFDM